MSGFTDAFADLLDASADALGTVETVTIGAQSGIQAIVTELTTDEVVIAGGIGDSGGFRIEVAVAALSAEPEPFTTVTAQGRTMHVLPGVQTINRATYLITCGDPST